MEQRYVDGVGDFYQMSESEGDAPVVLGVLDRCYKMMGLDLGEAVPRAREIGPKDDATLTPAEQGAALMGIWYWCLRKGWALNVDLYHGGHGRTRVLVSRFPGVKDLGYVTAPLGVSVVGVVAQAVLLQLDTEAIERLTMDKP